MAVTNAPVFTQTPTNGHVNVTAANTKSDGTGTIATDIFLAYTAGANGAFIRSVTFTPVNSTIGTATTNTTGRVFRSTATSGATTGGTNTFNWGEANLPSQTPNTTTAVIPVVIPINRALKAGETILVTTHAAPAANTSQQVIVDASDY